jgi:hypothetical protein
MLYQDSFAADYILTHKNDAWFNLRGGRQAYAQGDLQVILWTGSYAVPKRLRWECTFKGEPILLKHPSRIFRALACNARENYISTAMPYIKSKFPEEYEAVHIKELKNLLKIQ